MIKLYSMLGFRLQAFGCCNKLRTMRDFGPWKKNDWRLCIKYQFIYENFNKPQKITRANKL